MAAAIAETRLVAVTGATGFLGRRLVPALQAGGWRVRVLVRRRPPENFWGVAAPEMIVGDIADAQALRTLADGAGRLIHGAGLIQAARREDFARVNIEGARLAALAAPPGGMILVSSLAAREPELSTYAASKRAGEIAALVVLGPRLSTVRPPAIYGPGDRETLALFQLAARSPVLPMPGAVQARTTLAHVDDVVATIVHSLTRRVRPPLVTVAGARPEGYSWWEIFTQAARAVGRRPRLASMPAWSLRAAGAAAGGLAALSGRAAIFNSGKVAEILHADWAISRAEQGPDPLPARFDLPTGFAHTVAWYRTEGWLT